MAFSLVTFSWPDKRSDSPQGETCRWDQGKRGGGRGTASRQQKINLSPFFLVPFFPLFSLLLVANIIQNFLNVLVGKPNEESFINDVELFVCLVVVDDDGLNISLDLQ